YLVRRLLENGANTSFVHQVADSKIPLERLTADPLAQLPDPYVPNPRVPLPRNLYPERLNARGIDLSDPRVLERLERRVASDRQRSAPDPAAMQDAITEPADRRRIVGVAHGATPDDVNTAVATACSAWRGWDATPAAERAAILEHAAERVEGAADELISLLVREAGKTFADCVSEMREAA